MWKKFIIICLTLIGTFSVGYAYYNLSLDAASGSSKYYGVGEVFEETGSNKFLMGNRMWEIIFADETTGNGIIMSANTMGIAPQSYQATLNAYQGGYDLTNNDVIGEIVKSRNDVSVLQAFPKDMYDTLTNHEQNQEDIDRLISVTGGFFYLTPDDDGKPLYFDKRGLDYDGSFAGLPFLTGYKYIHVCEADARLSSPFYLFFSIKLPSKLKKIEKIESDILTQSKKVGSNIDIFHIHTTEGDGPFHFTIYDTDENGNGDPSLPSSHFLLENIDSINGTVQVNQKQTLTAGDYYFKVRGVDESTDENLYEDASDFTKDKSRMKETQVIHVIIEKVDTTIAFQNPNDTKKSITEAATNWNEIATATPSDGTKITYTVVGGDIGLIDLDEDTGEVTYKGSNAFGKVKIRATVDDDPTTGQDNYHSSFAEKEIIITREVDGVLTPDPASSDATVPTFSTDKANIKTNGVIGTIQGTKGTPDVIGGATTTYRYEIKAGEDGSYFKVDETTGVIKSNVNLAVGSYTFTITVSDKWSFKDISVTVNVGKTPAETLKFYESPTSDTMITKKSAKITDTNVSVYATVKGSTNNNPVTYRLKDGEPQDILDVNEHSGMITMKKVGTVIIVAEKQGGSGQADAVTELEFTVTAGSQAFIYVDESGNELSKTNDRYDVYEEVYEKGKTFQLYTSGGNATRTRSVSNQVTFALKKGSPTDVITVDEDGLVHILNASLNTQKGKVIVEATSHDPNGNYEDKTIELPIDIKKADQNISFADETSVQNGKGKITPVVNAQDISGNDGGVTLNDTSYFISIGEGGNGVAWTNNGKDIEYSYDGEESIEIALHVEKAGNRNYNKAEAEGIMKILGKEESSLSISQPGKVVYGDRFTIRALQDDSSSTNVKYTFEVDNTIYISEPEVNDTQAEFDALKFSGNTEIKIKVTRTADGEVTLSKTVKVKVLPKDINITIDDKQKKQGEENPELTFQDFQDQLVSWNGVKDQVDSDDVKLSTTATKDSPGGSYPITGNPKTMNGKYPNYNFIFKDGKLMIEGMIDKDVDGDGKPDFNDSDGDGCPDLNIKWQDDNGDWVVINGDRDEDGIPDLNVDSDGDGTPDLNIDTDKDGKPDLNLVILTKAQWNPIKCVVVSDIVKVEYCTGTNVKPKINVDTNGDRIPDINIDTDGDMKANLNVTNSNSTKPLINIASIESWNPNKDYTYQKFSYDTINHKPYLNIDTNKDGCPDINIDTNNDGIADLNIDVDGDLIPDTDIDTTGDGKADTNIDTDGDGIPDEKIMEITKWEPNKRIGEICTMVIKQDTELEDNDIKVEKPDGTPFLPNFALKVEDVTEKYLEEVKEHTKEFTKDIAEVKKVVDVKLLKDGVEVQPDGIIKVKIPYEGIKNPILMKRSANGAYEKIEYKIEDGYLIYETDELGIVAIIGDNEIETSVKGDYNQNIGGANTGDSTALIMHIVLLCFSITLLFTIFFQKKSQL